MMQKTILITGASSGIGYELAKIAAEEGYYLILVARNKKTLLKVAKELHSNYKVSALIIEKDLSLSHSALDIYSEVKKHNLNVDILVNNAGFGSFGDFLDSDREQQMNMIDVNCSSLVALTHYFLKDMKDKNFGRIMNVGSLAGFQPGGPKMAVYFATKAFVLSFSQGLSEELKDSGISVTCLCPGSTETGFHNKAGISKMSFLRGNLPSAFSVALEGWKGMMKKKRLVIPGWKNKIVVLFDKILPRDLILYLIKRGQDKTNN